MNTDRFIETAYRRRRWIVAMYMVLLMGWLAELVIPVVTGITAQSAHAAMKAGNWAAIEISWYSWLREQNLVVPGVTGVFGWESRESDWSWPYTINPLPDYPFALLLVLAPFTFSLRVFLGIRRDWSTRLFQQTRMPAASILSAAFVGGIMLAGLWYLIADAVNAAQRAIANAALDAGHLNAPFWIKDLPMWWFWESGHPWQIGVLCLGGMVLMAILIRRRSRTRKPLIAQMARLCGVHACAAALIWLGGLALAKASPETNYQYCFPFAAIANVVQEAVYTVTFLAACVFMWHASCLLIMLGVWSRHVTTLRRHQCGKCGYDLRGLTSMTCPECGEPITPERRSDHSRPPVV